MKARTKLGLGSPLACLGGLALVLVPLMGWTFVMGPWSFAIGLMVGITTGAGVALSITGLIEQRMERRNDPR
jgi:hypothetical protein